VRKSLSWFENANLLFLDQICKKEPTLAGLIFGAQNGEKNPRQNVTNLATAIADFQQVAQLSCQLLYICTKNHI